MGSYENIVKLEEIRRKVEENDFLSAGKILDTMVIKKIKNMADLNLIAEVFSENEHYDEAAELYIKIYEKMKTRKALYQLIDISVKRGNVEDAEYFLLQYQKAAPEDFYRYIFRYRIDKLKGESYERLIETLQDLKRVEYTEQWAYELAKLYYKAGMEEACIAECSDIILWFGEGSFVEKARMLRAYYSGETDKDRMIEELKRRANEIQSKDTEDEEPGMLSNKNYEEYEEWDSQETVHEGDSFNPDMEYTMGQDESLLEDGLKNEIKDMLSQDLEDKPDQQEITSLYEEEDTYPIEEGVTSGEGYLEETEAEEPMDNPLNETAAKVSTVHASHLSEKELAEQEVESTIYQLLQDENVNEEDRRLRRLEEDWQVSISEIFGDFLHVQSVRKQLAKCLEGMVQEQRQTLMLIITGSKGAGKTTLAKDMALFLYKTGKLKTSKIARIKAEKLNNVDIMAKKDTLKDGCLVIEDASELKRGTIDKLMELRQMLQADIAIIFEENKKNMNKLFREYPKLMDLLKNRLHLPQYTKEDLLGFSYAGFKQQDYHLDQKAELLLKTKINRIATMNPEKQLEQTNKLTQSAIDAADIRMGSQLPNLASQGLLKNVEILTVLPEDFKD